MPTPLLLGKDVAGQNAFAPSFCYDKYSTNLATDVVQTLTVPSTSENWIAAFSFQPGADVWVSLNGTAAVAGSSFALSTSDLNPGSRTVKAGDVLSFITHDTTAYVWVGFYAV